MAIFVAVHNIDLLLISHALMIGAFCDPKPVWMGDS
jgi:hypothetical protein